MVGVLQRALLPIAAMTNKRINNGANNKAHWSQTIKHKLSYGTHQERAPHIRNARNIPKRKKDMIRKTQKENKKNKPKE